MATKEITIPDTGNLAILHESADGVSRFRAMSHALEAADDPRCARPIPRFMLDMPWASEDSDVSERILAKLLSADNPLDVEAAGATLSGKNLVGRVITVHDIRVAPSTFESGWGAYLLCDITVGDDMVHDVMTVGAKEAVAKLAYAYFTGQLPITGTMTVITVTGKGNTVLGFVVEQAF
jgi:hypothetical protein